MNLNDLGINVVICGVEVGSVKVSQSKILSPSSFFLKIVFWCLNWCYFECLGNGL